MSNILEEYLVKIGAEVDRNAFNGANQAILQITRTLQNLGTTLKLGGFAVLFAKVTESIVGNMKSVADLDMQYQKLGVSMWVTTNTAKSLKVAMETMGASEQEIAWIPELREQFFRLREEMNALATPSDAEGQLSWIRQIEYDVQSLQVKLKMLREWIVYYLIKYLKPYIEQFQKFIQWLNDKLGNNMPAIAKKIASALASVVSVVVTVAKFLKDIWHVISGLGDHIPKTMKKLVVAFAVAGAAIMMSPFGLMLTAIGAALILLQDFYYYIEGKKSSKTLAPMWAMLVKFGNGAGRSFLDGINNALNQTFEILKAIFEGIDFENSIEYVKQGLKDILKGLGDIINALGDLMKKFKATGPTAQSFFKGIGKAVGFAIRQFGRVLTFIGRIMSAIALAIQGDFKAAALATGHAFLEFAKGSFNDGKNTILGGGERVKSSGPLAEQAAAAAQYVSKRTGIPAEIIYAQWAHESTNFTSRLAMENMNMGGLTQTEWNGDDNKQPDGNNYYKVYGSMQEYADDYIKSFISKYDFDPETIQTPEDFARLLKRNGYYGASLGEYTAGIERHMGAYQDAIERYQMHANEEAAKGNVGLNYNADANPYGLKANPKSYALAGLPQLKPTAYMPTSAGNSYTETSSYGNIVFYINGAQDPMATANAVRNVFNNPNSALRANKDKTGMVMV